MIIEIRKATEADVDAILEVTKDAFSQYAKSLGQPKRFLPCATRQKPFCTK